MFTSVKTYLAQDWEAFEKLFSETIASDVNILDKVNRYVAEHGGKQLRPMLCLLFARLAGGACNCNSIRCAVASEMIHTATLMHDDVADESGVRRGFPTLNALLNPTAAVLVGDYWLSRGVSVLLDTGDPEIFRYFTICLGDLAKGEMFQIEKASALDTTYGDYIYIIAHKTASLFAASMKSGVHSVTADEAKIKAAGQFAYHLGLAFQMRDDILDYSPQLAIGKPTGQDIKERKITIPLIGALQNAPEAEGKGLLANVDAGACDGVLPFVQKYDGIAYAQKMLREQTASAVESLEAFAPCRARDMLSALAQSLTLRNK